MLHTVQWCSSQCRTPLTVFHTNNSYACTLLPPLLASHRDVVNVVTFSLKAAEQTLLEDHPDTHAKLVTGRLKRLKLLQDSIAVKQKETNRRALELCSENSSHLEDIQKTAADRVSSLAAQFKDAVEVVRGQLCLAGTDFETIQK